MAFLYLIYSCSGDKKMEENVKTRGLVDTIGFAHLSWQMDSVMARIYQLQEDLLKKSEAKAKITDHTSWKMAISPHDDYTYVGYLYPAVLRHVKAPTIFLFGVAHKARKFGLENKIIFGTYDFWHGPYKPVRVSKIRDEIIQHLPPNTFIIHDSMMTIEHSLEALIPFLQYFHEDFEIIPILIPYMSYERMQEIAQPLAKEIARIAQKNHWQWGKDFAFVISTDAVHYGDEDWGGKNFAYFGADENGYRKAVEHEHKIINECLVPAINPRRIRKFTEYTVHKDNFKEYKWTWCGRYSVPFGTLTGYYLSLELNIPIKGTFIGYANSLDHPHVPVRDLNMGITAPANIHHWVGYVAIGYE
jgi:AmmeMemoRadiSam system protein B